MNGSIRRKSGNSWQIIIDLGRDANGKKLRKYVTVKGAKALAQRQLRELLTAQDKGLTIQPKEVTLAAWVEKWLAEYVRPKNSQHTYERYHRLLQRHVLPVLGDVELTKLTPGHVKSLEAELSAHGMAPAGVELVHCVISGLLKKAVREELVWRNVCKAVSPPKVDRKEVEPPEVAEVLRVLDIAKKQEHQLYPCLHLIAYTGLRRGEALGLKWQDVNLEAGTISIVRSLGRSVEKGLVFASPKTRAGRRVVDLDDDTVAVLRAHQGRQLLWQVELGDVFEGQGLVFPNDTGGPLNPMKLTRAYQGLAEQARVRDRRLHDLRHFQASVLLQSGQSIVLVSKRLGHASVSTTADIYAHIAPGWQKEAAQRFAAVMRGET
jgi:integrase